MNAVGKAVLGGWQISGVTRFLSGSPFGAGYSITGAGGVNLTGSNTEGARIAVVGNPNTGSDNPYSRINPAAFAPPQVGSLGLESGVNYLTGPGINNWDMSLQKLFHQGARSSPVPHRCIQRVQPHAVQRREQHADFCLHH